MRLVAGVLRSGAIEHSRVTRGLVTNDVIIIIAADGRMILGRTGRGLGVHGLVPIMRVPFVHVIVPVRTGIPRMVVPIIGSRVAGVISGMTIPAAGALVILVEPMVIAMSDDPAAIIGVPYIDMPGGEICLALSG